MINVLSKYKYYIVVGICILVGVLWVYGKLPRPEKSNCEAQDKLIHELQEKSKRDSSLLVLLQSSKSECTRQAVQMINEYEKQLKKREKTIELLKNSNFVLKEGLEAIQSQGAKIDSTKFTLKQLQTFFDEY